MVLLLLLASSYLYREKKFERGWTRNIVISFERGSESIAWGAAGYSSE